MDEKEPVEMIPTQDLNIVNDTKQQEKTPNSIEPLKMSKNQQKRLIREAKRNESKAEWRKLQKAKRKLKEQLKKDECIAKGKPECKYSVF